MADYHQYKRKKPLIEIMNARGIKFNTRTTIQQMKDLIDADIEAEEREKEREAEEEERERRRDAESSTASEDSDSDFEIDFETLWCALYKSPFYVNAFIIEVYELDYGYSVPTHVLYVIMRSKQFFTTHDTFVDKKLHRSESMDNLDGAKLSEQIESIVKNSDKTVVSLTNTMKMMKMYRNCQMRENVENID